jgi:hypothetical protein
MLFISRKTYFNELLVLATVIFLGTGTGIVAFLAYLILNKKYIYLYTIIALVPFVFMFLDYSVFDKVSYENSIGQIFAKSLSSRLDIPIVPPLKGKAIGGSIPLSFSDSSKVANLQLPELDYSFDIKIRGFKKVKLDETALREAWVYGSYLTISFGLEGMHDQSSRIKNGYVVEKVKSDDLNDWQQFDYSTEIVFKEFTDSISKPNKKWVKEKTNLSFKEAKSYFSYVKEKLDSAR